MSISRRIFELSVPAALALLHQITWAQSILDFDDWMQKIDRGSQSMQKSIARMDANEASADARKIGELYASMETYFARRGNAVNAVKLSKEGKELAAAVVQSLAANDLAAASKAALSIAHACRTCHLEYKPLE